MSAAKFTVYIQPRASRTELAGTHDGALKIRIAAPPVDNAANRALIDFIAQQLGVAKRHVRIVSGTTGRRKTLEVDGVSPDLVATRLGQTGRKQPACLCLTHDCRLLPSDEVKMHQAVAFGA